MHRISQSRELVLLREIARWWQQYQVAAQCRFTTLLLKRTGRFEDSVNTYFENGLTSPYMEQMARGFLKTLASRGDALLSQVAQTELGLLEVKHRGRTDIAWDRNPDLVFAALEAGTDLPERDEEWEYRLGIGKVLQCVRQRREPPQS